jgi:hypothetical protein
VTLAVAAGAMSKDALTKWMRKQVPKRKLSSL